MIEKPISRKQILVDLTVGQTYTGLWVPDSPGVWKTKIYFLGVVDTDFGQTGFAYGDFETGTQFTLSVGGERIRIGSFFVDEHFYSEKFSIAELYEREKTYYWDQAEQTLWVKFDPEVGDPNFTNNTLVIGVIEGYSAFAATFDDYYYEPRVIQVPNIKQSRDTLYFGLITFDSGQVTLDNTDGFFDNLAARDVYGQTVSIKYGFDDQPLSEYTTIYTGFFESFNNTATNTVIKIRDPRKNISVDLPYRIFDRVTYPNMEEDLDGTIIPIGYGSINKQTAYQIDNPGSTFVFKFCDTTRLSIQSIDAVYVDGVEVTPAATDIGNAQFTLNSSVFEPGQDVSVTYKGYTIDNALNIIKDLIVNETGVSYNNNTFNTSEWEAATVLAPKIGLAVVESKTLIDIIGEISTTVQGVLFVQGDGRITFRYRDPDKEVVSTINVFDQLKATTEVQLQEEYTSKVRVGYKKAYSTGKHSYSVNDSEEAALFNRYRRRKLREIDTLLTNESDAQAFGSNFMETFGGVFPTFTFTVTTKFLDLTLEDNINAFVYFGQDRVRLYKLEVVGIKSELSLGEVIVTARFIEELEIPSGPGFPDNIIVNYNSNPDWLIDTVNIPDYIIGV